MLTVLVGPPCSGKSTYARRMARSGDVVVDYDALALALGSDRAHEAPRAVADVAFKVREAAVSRVIAKRWPAWVIHARPSAEQVGAYRDAGARFVLLDPGIDECLARCERDGRPPGTDGRIRDWYERPPDLAADWRVEQ